MRRLIQRGYPKRVQPMQPSAPSYGGILPGYTLDYAKYMELGTTGAATCYEIQGWYSGLRSSLAFRAYYYSTGRLVRGYGEAEDVYGHYPLELSPVIMDAIQVEHTKSYGQNSRLLFHRFSIKDVCPVDRPWYCEGCRARFMSKRHGDEYVTCPDHRMVCDEVRNAPVTAS